MTLSSGSEQPLLLDTSAYSAFRRGHSGVVAAIRGSSHLVMTPIVLGELRAGFASGSRRRVNDEELAGFLKRPEVGVVEVGDATAGCYAAIHAHLRRAGTPIPTNDLWIAASAMEHGLKVLTLDVHYLKVPQILVEYAGEPVSE